MPLAPEQTKFKPVNDGVPPALSATEIPLSAPWICDADSCLSFGAGLEEAPPTVIAKPVDTPRIKLFATASVPVVRLIACAVETVGPKSHFETVTEPLVAELIPFTRSAEPVALVGRTCKPMS